MVNPRYADQVFKPRERPLGINTVHDRVYRGRCASAPHLPDVFRRFNQQRDAIYALCREQRGLDPKIVAQTLSYLDEFYAVIADPTKVAREITERCRRF